jgi:acetyl esterase
MRKIHMSMAIPFLVLAFGLGLPLQGQTSEDNPKLKKALERYPGADADKDGILTFAEAKAFRDKELVGKAKGKKAGDAEAAKGGERMIYKKVGEVELPLYMFKPEGLKADAKVPAIVFFFGGGWSSGSPAQFEQQCKYLAGRGMVAVTVEYRVSSRHGAKIEDCIEDAKSAMRWVRGHAGELGIDPKRIASGGGSAGGHLAACVSVMDGFNAGSDDTDVSAKPDAMVLFNPAMALAPHEGLSPAYNARIGAGTDGKRANVPAKKISPLTYAAKQQPPCIMFFGTADVLKQGADVFTEASVKAGNDCRVVAYEGQSHGFFNHGRGGNKYYDLTLAEMDKFLVGLGWLAPAPD